MSALSMMERSRDAAWVEARRRLIDRVGMVLDYWIVDELHAEALALDGRVLSIRDLGDVNTGPKVGEAARGPMGGCSCCDNGDACAAWLAHCAVTKAAADDRMEVSRVTVEVVIRKIDGMWSASAVVDAITGTGGISEPLRGEPGDTPREAWTWLSLALGRRLGVFR